VADGAFDAVTIAFGIRNLRPLEDALRELRRVLRPGGGLVVLEACAPAPGPFAPFHRFYLRHLVPLAGRLSRDPSAYRYLSRSVFEFGAGPEFERGLAGAGFRVVGRRSFLFGATRLWALERPGGTDQILPPPGGNRLQIARPGSTIGVNLPTSAARGEGEWRLWTGVQLALAFALTAAFAEALWILIKSSDDLPLAGWHRPLAWILVAGGVVVFGVRTVQLVLRILVPRPRA
ncbi:MAG: class I SAM-dependent methyltransferase, partial [Candidatus Eiseniibacteriota bacterium]